MIRVLHLLGSSGAGGAESFVLDVARHIDARSFRLTVGILDREGPVSRLLTEAGAQVLHLPSSLRDPGNAWAFYRALRAQTWELVHSNVGGALGRVLLKAVRRRPILTHVHGLPDDWAGNVTGQTGERSMVAHRTYALCADAVLVSSQYMSETMRLLLGSGNAVIHYLPLGVDTIRFRRRSRDDDDLGKLMPEAGLGNGGAVFGFVGRLTPQKGVETFVQAARLVLSRQPDSRCVVIGDGPLRTVCRELVDEFGRQRCALLGERWDTDVWMARLDVLLMPSAWEPFGLVAVEAMAAGCPVVASDLQGLKEIIVSDTSGYLVDPRRPDLFAERALDLMRDEALRHRIAEASRRRAVSSFSVVGAVKQLEALYLAYGPGRDPAA